MPRTTVAIPLHRSGRWIDVVERNARALAPVATVVISDATGLDDTADRLAAALAGVANIQVVATDCAPGWLAHCEALREGARTEFFMWLAHDDDAEPSWVVEAEQALDADPTAVLACGDLIWEGHPAGSQARPITVQPYAMSPDPLERQRGATLAILHGRAGQLGVLFRSVQRRSACPPLLAVDADTFADVWWALRVLGRGRVAHIDVQYLKRYVEDSAHRSWPGLAEVAGRAHIARAMLCMDRKSSRSGRRAWLHAIQHYMAAGGECLPGMERGHPGGNLLRFRISGPKTDRATG